VFYLMQTPTPSTGNPRVDAFMQACVVIGGVAGVLLRTWKMRRTVKRSRSHTPRPKAALRPSSESQQSLDDTFARR
jgi:hypothetical protein